MNWFWYTSAELNSLRGIQQALLLHRRHSIRVQIQDRVQVYVKTDEAADPNLRLISGLDLDLNPINWKWQSRYCMFYIFQETTDSEMSKIVTTFKVHLLIITFI